MSEEFAVNSEPYQLEPTFLQLPQQWRHYLYFRQFSRRLHDYEGEKTVILRFQYPRNAPSNSFETSEYGSVGFCGGRKTGEPGKKSSIHFGFPFCDKTAVWKMINFLESWC